MNGLRVSAGVVLLFVCPQFAAAQSQNYYNPHVVPSGTRFLAALDSTISTKEAKAGDQFQVVTLETLTEADGAVIPAGTAIRGHVDKVQKAHETGRAKLWLSFDDFKTPTGWVPIVAVVDDIPGTHSIRVDNQREGEIEAQSDTRKDAEAAAAAGAFAGAAAGVASRNAKDAAMGAAVGAVTAFMAVSGLGQEITLDRTTKLELTLERDLSVGGA